MPQTIVSVAPSRGPFPDPRLERAYREFVLQLEQEYGPLYRAPSLREMPAELLAALVAYLGVEGR